MGILRGSYSLRVTAGNFRLEEVTGLENFSERPTSAWRKFQGAREAGERSVVGRAATVAVGA